MSIGVLCFGFPWRYKFPLRTSFFVGIRKTQGGNGKLGDLKARLDWAGLFLVVSRSRFNLSHFKFVSERESITRPSPGPGSRKISQKSEFWKSSVVSHALRIKSTLLAWETLSALPSISSFEPVWPFRLSGGQVFSPLQSLILFLPPEWHPLAFLCVASVDPFRSQCHLSSEAFPNQWILVNLSSLLLGFLLASS